MRLNFFIIEYEYFGDVHIKTVIEKVPTHLLELCFEK
jgi:hypothetical protein